MKKAISNVLVGVLTFFVGISAIYFPLRAFFSTLTLPEIIEVEFDEKRPRFSEQNEPGVQKSDLYVFVGEKIDVTEVVPPNGEIWFDSAFDAKYRILETVSGEFDGDVIEFRAFDHYGFPPFATQKNALLFVSKYKGKLYHEKYQYYHVYQTIDGRWAACGDPYLGMDYHRKPFLAKDLVFPKPVVFERHNLNNEQFKSIYFEPFFETNGRNAVCKMGAYVNELFQIKRDGILKARGIGQSQDQ